jgi:hypothetical protein
MLRVAAPLIALAALAAAGVSHASTPATGPQWATVNICDSAANPNAMGVRASMPGDGSDGQMLVRFTAQWYSHSRKAWVPVAGSATSPWLSVGSARLVAGQAGYTFSFDAPPGGQRFLLRAVAQMQWQRGGAVVRSDSRVTQGGYVGVMAGDPVGTSRTSCLIE